MKRRTATVLLMAVGVGLSAAEAEHPTASKKAPKKAAASKEHEKN